MSNDLMTREEVEEILEAVEGLDDEETHLARTALAAMDAQRELWTCLNAHIYTKAINGALVCGECYADFRTPHSPNCIITRLNPRKP